MVVPGQLVRDSIAQFIQLQVRKLQAEITNLAQQLGTTCGSARTSLVFQTRPVKTNSGR